MSFKVAEKLDEVLRLCTQFLSGDSWATIPGERFWVAQRFRRCDKRPNRSALQRPRKSGRLSVRFS
jgi:hypothetical protein